MSRTKKKIKIIPELKKEEKTRTKTWVLNVEKSECFWPCPCGGKLYNPPPDCEYKQYKPKGTGQGYCVDLGCCISICSKSETCNFFKERKEGHYEKLSSSIGTKNGSQKTGRTKYPGL